MSIGAHPSFNDPENFGRKRLNLSEREITKLIIDQINILAEIAKKNSMKVTHVKPHGALNNMACENFELASVIAKSIIEVDQDLIFLVPTGSEMEKAGKMLKMKIAAEIFADRNYEDDGNLISRSKPNALIAKSQLIRCDEFSINSGSCLPVASAAPNLTFEAFIDSISFCP